MTRVFLFSVFFESASLSFSNPFTNSLCFLFISSD
jgi:hypothetical protein